STPSGDVWLGSDFGSPKWITQVRFIPVAGRESKMVNGKFQASNTADFSHPTTLFVIKRAPKAGVWTTQPISAASAFRYVRYVGADGSLADVAGASFVGL